MTTTDLAPIETVPAAVFHAGRCHLGEGPGHDAETGLLWWFDILERRLHEADLATGTVTITELPVMASAMAMVDANRQVISAEDGLHLRDRRTGHLTRIASIEADAPGTRSNDGRVHPSGTFWISTMGKGTEKGAGSLYAFQDGRVAPLFRGLTIPNAICFSPDGRTGYFTDTKTYRLNRVALDPATGLPVAEPETLYAHPGPGGLDGAVTDAEGRIWCALWGAGAVAVLSPEGDLLRRIAVPARQPTCPVFVGPGLDRLLVTSAFEGLDAAGRAADPGHGQTFVLEVGARGRPEPRLRLEGLS